MKNFVRSLMVAAVLTGATAPALAAPAPSNPAAALSVAKSARAAAPARHDARFLGVGGSTATFGIIGAIVILAVVLIATNDTPTSV